MGGKGSTQAKLPTPGELDPLLQVQSKYNRVGVETPFGEQRYERLPDGSYKMVTDIGDEGQALVSRAVGLGMTDSNRLSAPGQMNGIAGALASRIGQRMGLEYGNQPIQLTQSPAMPAAKPPQQTLPPPNGLPQQPPPQQPPVAPPQGGGGGGGFNGNTGTLYPH